jgi:hypothetical protein
MTMQFTLTISADISSECDAGDLGLDDLNGNDLFDVSSYKADIDGVMVTGTVTIEARASVSGIEVAASDMSDFDADTVLAEALNPYGGIDVSNATFEVESSPTGYDEVLGAVGYDTDTAIAVYAALAAAGFEVN